MALRLSPVVHSSITMDACDICGETRIDHANTRTYKIKNQLVTMTFFLCLHTPEEYAAAELKQKQSATSGSR